MDIAQSLPRFRTDLVAQPIDEAGQYFVDVADPDSGKKFRFYEVEYSIATAMNGARDIAGLASWADAELGLQPTRDEVENVINTLAELGYLDTRAPVLSGPGGDSDDDFDMDPGLAAAGASPMPLESPSEPELGLPDFDLGSAGVSGLSLQADLPAPADLELGLAGGLLGRTGGRENEEATFVAPSLSLGKAGNEKATSSAASDFAGLGEDGEDDLPTTIKGANHLMENARGSTRPSDPGIPPRPPTSLPPEAILTPVTSGDDDDDPTQLPAPATDFDDEMSVDLSDHMQLGPDALKEAVRQSQMIKVVTPEELADIAEAPESAPAKPPVVAPLESPEVAPTELPQKAVNISKPPVAKPTSAFDDEIVGPSTQPSSTGKWVVGLLVVGLLVAAGLVYMLNLFDVRTRLGLEKADTTEQPAIKKPVVNPVVKPPVPQKPKLPSATLAAGEPVKTEVTAVKKGVLATLIESGTEVEEGGDLGTYRGGEGSVRTIASVGQRRDHYQNKLDKANAKVAAAESAGNAVAAKAAQKDVARYEKKVAEKQGKIDEENAKLEAFKIKAAVAGTFETELAAGAKVAQGAVIGTLSGKPLLTAEFTLPKNKKLAKGDEVEVVSKSDDKKRLGCQVTSIEGQKATIECPAEKLSAGNEVVLP